MALIILASSYTRLTRLNDEQVLSIDREVYDLDDVLVLTIQNVYGDSILVDVDCRIQVWTGGYWRELNTDSTDSGYDAAAKVLAPGETYRQIVNLRRLGEGRYRIGKQITHLEEQTNMFWIEFQIEG
ncbi:hypothetical protein JXL21_12005 [Candidatus Bathyarchaeota archaeon]|nr:hypothetical protein [Candidatus Bathyarchaeota archaeon]